MSAERKPMLLQFSHVNCTIGTRDTSPERPACARNGGATSWLVAQRALTQAEHVVSASFSSIQD